MAVALLATTDTCVKTAGLGMATTWTLTGLSAAYDGTLTDTDGYKITATMTW